MARKTYSRTFSPDAEQSQDWQFGVRQEELVTSDGVKSGIHAVVRNDNGLVIGSYKGNKVLPYTDIVDKFETGLNDAGLKFNRSIICTGNGSRFFARYKVGEMTIASESFGQFLSLQSSHDGSLSAGFAFEAMRLVCLNGMMISQKVFSIFKKHSENLDLAFLSANIVTALDAGNNHLNGTVSKMAEIQLSDANTRTMLSNIVEMGATKGVSPRTGHLIYDNWQHPADDEKGLGDNLWRLYNSATRLTRDIENKGRFEMSRKANLFLTGAMDLAARNEGNLNRLLAAPKQPLDFDAVEVQN